MFESGNMRACSRVFGRCSRSVLYLMCPVPFMPSIGFKTEFFGCSIPVVILLCYVVVQLINGGSCCLVLSVHLTSGSDELLHLYPPPLL